MAETTGTHCPTCGAPIRAESSRFCAFCGTKLPEPPKVVVQAWAPNAPERFEAAKRHPGAARLLQHTPSSAWESVWNWILAVASAALALFGAFVAVGVGGANGAGQGPFLFGIVLLVLGTVLTWGSVLRARRFQSAPVTRVVALVADERVRVRGGKHASTTYFASFELEDGERFEVEVGEELASGLARNDMGVLYLKRGVLLGFARIQV